MCIEAERTICQLPDFLFLAPNGGKIQELSLRLQIVTGNAISFSCSHPHLHRIPGQK
jgi:hypothetical protein